MQFQKLGDRELTADINFRLLPEEKEKLKQVAEAAGMTLSALCRSLIFARPVVAKIDLTMVNELRKTAGLLKHTHNLTGGTHATATAEALRDLRRLLVKLLEGVVTPRQRKYGR